MKGEIVKRIKSGQRTAPMWSRAWLNYISKNGNGNSDPAEYDEKFLCDFVNWLVLPGSMEMGGGMQSSSGTSADTSIGKCSKEPMGVGTRDSQKDDLVRKIKSFQRRSAPQTAAWWKYAEEELGGVRDPAKHDVIILEQFCEKHGITARSGGPTSGASTEARPGSAQFDPTDDVVENYQDLVRLYRFA